MSIEGWLKAHMPLKSKPKKRHRTKAERKRDRELLAKHNAMHVEATRK